MADSNVPSRDTDGGRLLPTRRAVLKGAVIGGGTVLATLFVLFAIIIVAPSGKSVFAIPPGAQRPTPSPAQMAPLACEVAPDVKLGEKATITCTGFTRNGSVKVVFNRPDGSTSDHVGRADENGGFHRTFTVDPDRPTGTWTLELTDASSGRKIAIPFTVTAPPVTTPTAPAPPPAPPPAPAPSPDS